MPRLLRPTATQITDYHLYKFCCLALPRCNFYVYLLSLRIYTNLLSVMLIITVPVEKKDTEKR